MSKKTKKQRAYKRGLLGEFMAALLLRLKGYAIITRRFKTPVGAIDIVAAKRGLLTFVEVKNWRSHQSEEVLTPKQINRITRAASLFIAKRREFANFSVRFDVVIIRKGFYLRHIKGAWG